MSYIYLIQDGKDLFTNIFKIGKTKQGIDNVIKLKRFNNYSKGTIQHNTWLVSLDNVDNIEINIKKYFKTKYILVRGFEWFEGNVKQMKKDIDLIIEHNDTSIIGGVTPLPPQEPTDKALMMMILKQNSDLIKDQKISKKIQKYNCELCKYNCCKQSEYNKHLSTRKHQLLLNPLSNIPTYSCECGKIYKHSPTLYAHKKQCIYINNSNNIIEDHIEDHIAIHIEDHIEDHIAIHIEDKHNDKNDIIIMLLNQNTKLIKDQPDIKQGAVTPLTPQEPTPQEPTPQEPITEEPITEEPTDKALMMMILKQNSDLIKDQKISKKIQKYNCELCKYNCSKQSEYTKHLFTSKHVNRTKQNVLEHQISKISKCFTCKNCNKCYNVRNSLWYHEKKCIPTNNSNTIIKDHIEIHMEDDNDANNEDDNAANIVIKPTDKDDIIIMLLKQNTELIKDQADIKQIIMELVKNGITNNTTNNINSHNKAFNLNFFLNDTCKNAMNINEFLDSIQLELNDLMELGELGYVASMSKIIAKNLNALDETIRPIHCTDTKREIFYIKDDNKWEKEDVEMKKLRKLILKLSLKTYKLLPQYREKFPDYNSSTSTHSDEHCIIIMEAMTCDKLKDEKIIRNISKVTTISK
jgi:hypothetical protein